MSEDEFDALPDDFADISGVDWATLLGGPSEPAGQQDALNNIPEVTASPISRQPSTPYFSEGEEMDESFLAAVDRAEQEALAQISAGQSTIVRPNAGQSSSVAPTNVTVPTHNAVSSSRPQLPNESQVRASRHFSDMPVASSSKAESDEQKASSLLPCKRSRPDEPTHASPKGKGKMKAENFLQSILANYEDEMTCPICCDLLVASHVGNPCGHTFCGECGWQWHVENKHNGCPCCRQDLDQDTPMIPNIAMDNTVEKHIKALFMSGLVDWDVGGRKFKEWAARRDTWRSGLAKRERKMARRSRAFIPVRAFGFLGEPEQFQLPRDDLDADPTYEDSDVELIPRPIRRARRGRRRGSGVVIELG